ncbi:MAG: hypothetical protein IIU78_02190 [Alistipes sp.]|nr:hypothetical protein [Alistipes sp.]
MKKLLLMFAAVATLFTACNKECDHNDIKHDHSADIVGTWTCLTENYAEALIINADGSAVSYGVEDGEYWENVKGTIVTDGNNITMTFEDNDNLTGHFDIIPGVGFSLFEDSGERYIYQYCANDLTDEVVGMWVCNDGLQGVENDMAIITYSEDGKMIMTAPNSTFIPGDFVNQECDYKVVGDLLFKLFPKDNFAGGGNPYLVSRVAYTPNGTSMGDILIEKQHTPTENGIMELTFSFLRVKQSLDLANNSYDYSNIYVTNVKAKDAEFEFAGQTLNLATMDGRILDKMMKNLLFNVSFPSSNEIVYNYHYNGENIPMPATIVVEGNKMTIKKSVSNPIYKDIDVWTFQDQDNTQMHMYMPTYAFENFLANTAVEMMAQNGELDLNDAEAVAAIYNGVADAIETINVSFIFKAAK